MKLAHVGAAALLILGLGCDRLVLPRQRPVYAAWEEGLTLGFEDPSTADPGLRAGNRLTVRVKASEPTASGLAVTKTFTSLTGQYETKVLQKDGGVRLLIDAQGGIMMLPEGFPDRVSRWEARGAFNWVVGRATASLPGVAFASPADAVGVWVESVALANPAIRTRTLFLPGIGEAETLTWVPAQGRWVVTNQLVTRGFTDLPTTTQSGSAL